MLEKLLSALIPKLLDFLQSERFQQLIKTVIAGLEKLLEEATNAEGS